MLSTRKFETQKFLYNYKKRKKEDFDFERISKFFLNANKSEAHQVISYRTFLDLDFEELFTKIDRTCSTVGQQYFYKTLRMIPKEQNGHSNQEKIIKYLAAHPDKEQKIVSELFKLREPRSYFIQNLIYEWNIDKPKWFWLIPVLSISSFVSLILSIINPFFLHFFLLIIVINTVLHLWNKKNNLTYSNTIPQLVLLRKISLQLTNTGVFFDQETEVKNSCDRIQTIMRLVPFVNFKLNNSNLIEMFFDYLFEMIKSLFAIEPITLFSIVSKLEKHRPDIEIIFNAVGKVDMAISISSLRETLPYFSFPQISPENHSINATEIFHPLISKPIANSIEISDDKSVLISGSNMSGKTTFLRTIGVNLILAQTINTVCAKSFSCPPMRIHSAINIADSIMDNTSYYYQEVKAIKNMIEESESGFKNLFLLDELFKGTNTVERISSGKSVLSYLNQNENIVIVSTHDLELIELLKSSFDFYHFDEIIENGEMSFDFKLRKGKSNSTNAIKILEINQFPKQITHEANEIARKFRETKAS